MNVNKISRYHDLALNTARTILRPNKHVSMIFKGNSLLAVGINDKNQTHPLAERYGYLFSNLHSELSAWIKIRHMEHNKLTLVNWHFNSRDQMKLARPCSKCLNWCISLFDEIYYSTSDGIVRF